MELVNLAKNPVPSGAVCGMLPSFDGTPMRYAIWQASRGPRRGTVCLFTGRTEFIEKYFEVVADLRRRGLAVAALDWRGQGGSGRALANPRKGHVDSFSSFDKDVIRFMRDVVLPDCPPPYTALAHSMGGNILLRAACMPGSWFERMVLCAPMVQLAKKTMSISPGLARIAAEGATTLGLGTLYSPGGSDAGWEDQPFEGNVLTSSQERYTRNAAVVKSVPELGIGAPTWGWMRAALRSMDTITGPRFPAEIKVPIFFIAAGADDVVSSRAIEDLSVQLKVAGHIVIPHARHEILQEREDIRRQFWAAFDAYVGTDRAIDLAA